MESRKSIRRYRGTAEPTRPGLTWSIFCLLLLSLLYIPELSGIRAPPGCLNELLGADSVLWLSVFGLSFTSWSPEPGSAEAALAVGLVLAFFALCYLAIRAQVHYRLTLGVWLIGGLTAAVIVSRARSSGWDFLAPVSVMPPLIIAIFVVYFVYLGVVAYLWHRVPGLQLNQGLFLPRVWEQRSFSVPLLVEETINDVYRGKPSRMGVATSAVEIRYSSYFGSWIPAKLRKAWKMTYVVTYVGEVDEKGRPHGFGEWNDTYWHGEVLQGWWDCGVPRGPFSSRESGSGAGFVRLLVPYVRNRTDGLFKNNGRLEHGPLVCGVMETECCTAGIFFREYPKLQEFLKVNPAKSVAEDLKVVMDALLPMPDSQSDSNLVLQADLLRGLLVSGHNSTQGAPTAVTVSLVSRDGQNLPGRPHRMENFAEVLSGLFRHRPVEGGRTDSDGEEPRSAISDPEGDMDRLYAAHLSQPALRVEGWSHCSFDRDCEALVFLPGFNASTSDAVRILSQLLALGNFPPYIKPVVFSWPAGKITSFASAQTTGCESEATRRDLVELFRGLGSIGLRRVHIVSHSMGVRVLAAAASSLKELFLPADGGIHDSGGGGGGPVTDPEAGVCSGPMQLSTITLLNAEIGRHEFVDCYARHLTAVCPCVSIYADARDTALFGAELQNSLFRVLFPARRSPEVVEDLSRARPRKLARRRSKWQWEYSLGRVSKDLIYADGSLVDIDIIQTTYLGANVHEVRHNAFNLNRELVDDLRDIIVNKQRAYQRRNRLQYRGGNRYNFLVAPTHVVNP